MKTAKKTSVSLLTGLLVLIATLATSFNSASASIATGSSILPSILPYSITEHEINDLLLFADIDTEVEIEDIKIKIFGNNDDLVYSSIVCQSIYKCDERLNQLINQSDFITEVDNVRIYILNQ